MRAIELELDKLVGYTVVGSEEKRIKKLGSAKLGCKGGMPPFQIGELGASDDQVNAAT
jgi:hypothetical protein